MLAGDGGSSCSRTVSRRGLIASLTATATLLTACQGLPGPLALSTPTPTEPRRVRVAMPNLDAFQFLSTQIHNASNKIPRERYIQIEMMPVDLDAKGRGMPSAAEVPARYAEALNALAGFNAPDLALAELVTLPGLARASALKELTPLVKGESWFKPDDFYGNVLQSGQIRGKQLAVPLNLAAEVLLYNRKVFQARGLPSPQAGETWDQVLATAKTFTSTGGANGDRWGMYLTAASPSFLTVAWQRGAQVVSDDGTRIDLTEPGTIKGLEVLADVIGVRKVAPAPDKSLPPPDALIYTRAFFSQVNLMFPAISGQQAAMATSFAGGFAFVPTDSDVRFAEFPAANRDVVLGFPGIMLGIPRNAPDVSHSLNALRGLLEASSQTMLVPARKGVSDLRSVEGLLLESEATALSAAIKAVRCLPGDFPLGVLPLVQQEVVLPVLLGQKKPQQAAQDAQSHVQQTLAHLLQ